MANQTYATQNMSTWHGIAKKMLQLTKVAKVSSAIDEGEDLSNKNIDSFVTVDDSEGRCLICFCKRHVSKIY